MLLVKSVTHIALQAYLAAHEAIRFYLLFHHKVYAKQTSDACLPAVHRLGSTVQMPNSDSGTQVLCVQPTGKLSTDRWVNDGCTVLSVHGMHSICQDVPLCFWPAETFAFKKSKIMANADDKRHI